MKFTIELTPERVQEFLNDPDLSRGVGGEIQDQLEAQIPEPPSYDELGDTMIKIDEKKATPKQYAQSLVEDQLDKLMEGYWVEQTTLTEKEIEAVQDQLRKLANRIGAKYLGLIQGAFDEG